MKGLFFARPIEYRMETPAESLAQGDVLEGSIVAVNRGAGTAKNVRLEVGLAYGDFKKLKDKEADALELLQKKKLGKANLEPNEEQAATWSFDLPSDCPVTSKDGSLFLLYGGDIAAAEARSKIDLQVRLMPALEIFIASVENHFSFEAKSRCYSDGFTEVKFKPPSSYPTVEELAVLMRVRKKEGMDLQFRFRVKTLQRGGARGLKTKVRTSDHNFPHNQFLLHNTQPNRPLFISVMEEALAKATPGKLTKN